MDKKTDKEITEYNEAHPDAPLCELCSQPMPEGESSFRYHGYSGPCPESDEAK